MTVWRGTMSKPYYLQLKEVIQEKIEDGTYSPGKELPSERQIAEHYGVHPHTTRAALKLLEKDGLLQLVPRRGAFVNLRRSEEDNTELGFTLPGGKKGRRKRIVVQIRQAGPYYAKIFQVHPEEELYYVKQVVKEKKPLYMEELFVLKKNVPDFPELHPDIFSLSDILAQKNVPITRTSQLLKICDASKEVRKKLKLPEGSVVLHLERTDYDREGPVAFTKYYLRSEDLAVEVKFKKTPIDE